MKIRNKLPSKTAYLKLLGEILIENNHWTERFFVASRQGRGLLKKGQHYAKIYRVVQPGTFQELFGSLGLEKENIFFHENNSLGPEIAVEGVFPDFMVGDTLYYLFKFKEAGNYYVIQEMERTYSPELIPLVGQAFGVSMSGRSFASIDKIPASRGTFIAIPYYQSNSQ